MGKYGLVIMAGSKKMTPRQFGNSVAKMIGGVKSDIEYEMEKERGKYAIRSLLQIASIIFQRIISRTPMDEEYEYFNKRKMNEIIHAGEGNENLDDMKEIHKPDDSVARYDWKMTVIGENEKTFTCREFISMDPNFGMEFNSKKDIKLIHETLLKSGLVPKVVKDNGNDRPDFNIVFDNDNPHFKIIEYGRYRKGPSEPKEGENYLHGITEDKFTYQAPKGFYAITLKEYEAFLATTKSDSYRTISQKMMRQSIDKVFSDKKFNQILKVIEETTVSNNAKAAFEEGEKKKRKKSSTKEASEELKQEPEVMDDEMIKKHVFETAWDNGAPKYAKSYEDLQGMDKTYFNIKVKQAKREQEERLKKGKRRSK